VTSHGVFEALDANQLWVGQSRAFAVQERTRLPIERLLDSSSAAGFTPQRNRIDGAKNDKSTGSRNGDSP
jgi:hypothetical protein